MLLLVLNKIMLINCYGKPEIYYKTNYDLLLVLQMLQNLPNFDSNTFK